MSFKHYSAAPGLGLNYSLYAVPTGWVVSMAPLWWAIAKTEKLAPGAYNNAMPKESWAKIGDKIPGDVSRKITRAVDANNNNHVNLPLFAAAIIAGNIAGVDVKTLHACAAGWLASRVAYNLSYVLIEDPTWAYVRTGLYFAGLGSCFTLFVKAANRMKGLPL